MPAEFVSYMRIVPLTPDLRVFGFLMSITVSAALLFGLVPALQATRPGIVQASRGDFDAGTRTGRLRGALIVMQVTVCVLLLVCTGILLRTATRAAHVETGLRTDDLVQVTAQEAPRSRITERLRAHPLVRAMATTAESPIDGMLPHITAIAEGSAGRAVNWNAVSASYFDLFGVPLLRGRGLTDADAAGTPAVAVVSQRLAQDLWPGKNPLGRLVRIEDADGVGPIAKVTTVEVVGVVANAVRGWVGSGRDSPIMYFPAPLSAPGSRYFVRVAGDPRVARRVITDDLERLAPGMIEETHTARDVQAVQVYPFRASWWVAAAIGSIALILTVTGIYGVLAYLVAQRTREIGVRMALGAGAGAVVRLIVGESLRLALLGTAIGLGLAAIVSALFAGGLQLLDMWDPVGYVAGTAVVLASCALAALAPSRRAARVDPMVALRTD
jgi:predicted permease